ncbi:MAG: molybdate ABC transporter permease subunit [Armatimonadetes bacterium]|nr:molybdate ABC transporter permease subunit [Armatimonadota bacterium]
MSYDFGPILLTFRLASATTAILLILGIPLASWLAFTRFKLKAVIETVVSMPLVLPPTVIGFYLLLVLGHNGPVGRLAEQLLDLKLVFSFAGLVVASVLYSLPFMVHPLQAGFQGIPYSLVEASYVLGKSRIHTLFRVLLPNMIPAILTGIVLSFAHTIGEFGVVLMIGGSIPGETRVASIAIYDEVQALNYGEANFHALVLFAVTFAILLMVYFVNKKLLKPLKE